MRLATESGVLTKPPLRARDVLVYHLAEDLTGCLLYFGLIFSPWAFGTTEPWSIWAMNACGYCLGLLLFAKFFLRSVKGYQAATSTHPGARATVEAPRSSPIRPVRMTTSTFTAILALLTVLILSYCLIAAVNARANFDLVSGTFEYFRCTPWLPHSLDRQGSWQAFWKYLALACCFWALRDWLLGRLIVERRTAFATSSEPRSERLLPARARHLLWALTISGGLLATEGIVQRLSNSPRLLFLIQPEIHQTADTQFASYAYRANAAQYFNLLWPACLGFWWNLHRSDRRQSLAKHLPLLCAALMALCPLISGARGASLIDLGMLIAAVPCLLLSLACEQRRIPSNARSVAAVALCFAAVFVFGFTFGWRQLRPRVEHAQTDLREREQLYERGRQMARDYPIFGTGPGTFAPVFQSYRLSPETYWPAQLHNDWLETRITFGWIGSGLIAFAFLTICLRWIAAGGLRYGRQFVLLLWLSLAGCLIQARWDFPLQVYSILFLFLTWCTVLFTIQEDKPLAGPS